MFYKIVNVKVSLKTSAIFLDNVCIKAVTNNYHCEKHKNFVVVRCKYTFIIFKTNNAGTNHVNITKIPLIANVDDAVNCFQSLINCNTEKITIDNITATTSHHTTVNLKDILFKKEYKKLSHFLSLKYNNQVFPGLFLKFKIGTAILYHSGNFVIVGCKKQSDIECLIQNISALI